MTPEVQVDNMYHVYRGCIIEAEDANGTTAEKTS